MSCHANQRFNPRKIPALIHALTLPGTTVREVAGETLPAAIRHQLVIAAQTAENDEQAVAVAPGSAPTRKETLAVVRTLGGRLREARELCNMSQRIASEALGFSDSATLAKIEGIVDNNSVPLHLIPKAAKLYDVSTDYLFGLTDDWAREDGQFEDRESFGYLLAMRNDQQRGNEENLCRLAKQVRAVSDVVVGLAPLIELLNRGVGRAVNDAAFDEIGGSAAILSASARITGMHRAALIAFKKTKLDMTAWREDTSRGFPEALRELAELAEIDRPVAVRAAARVFGLPVAILRDAVDGECRELARSA